MTILISSALFVLFVFLVGKSPAFSRQDNSSCSWRPGQLRSTSYGPETKKWTRLLAASNQQGPWSHAWRLLVRLSCTVLSSWRPVLNAPATLSGSGIVSGSVSASLKRIKQAKLHRAHHPTHGRCSSPSAQPSPAAAPADQVGSCT